MSEQLETRIAALEAEVKRLKEMVETITIDEVDGDVSIAFGGPADSVSVFFGDVEGDVSVGLAAGANGLQMHSGDVDGDIGVGITGAANGIEITTGNVEGDVSCSGGQVKTGE